MVEAGGVETPTQFRTTLITRNLLILRKYSCRCYRYNRPYLRKVLQFRYKIQRLLRLRFTRSITARGILSVIRLRLPRGFLLPEVITPGSSSNQRWIVSVDNSHSDAICATVNVSCLPSSTKGSSFAGFRFLLGGVGSASFEPKAYSGRT